MAKVWMRAIRPVRIDVQGRLKNFLPGDWFEVGKQDAQKMIADGAAEIPRLDIRARVQDFDKCCVVVRGKAPIDCFGDLVHMVDFIYELELSKEYNFIWKPGTTPQGIEAGLARLRSFDGEEGEAWEILAMLVGENTSAADIGSEEEQKKTEQVIGDLRIPAYNTDQLWLRKTNNTDEIVKQWREAIENGEDERHSFLRALYTVRAFTCTLAHDWTKKWRR